MRLCCFCAAPIALWRLLLLFPTFLSATPYNNTNVVFIITDQQRYDAFRLAQEDRGSVYKKHLLIETPNLDKIAQKGVYFETAYCHYPLCAPSRTSLLTGCTAERTGVQSNQLTKRSRWSRVKQFEDKVYALESWQQILVEERGYVAEDYGKWHVPQTFYYYRGARWRKSAFRDLSSPNSPIAEHVIRYNNYDLKGQTPIWQVNKKWVKWPSLYKHALEDLLQIDKVKTPRLQRKQQIAPWTGFPYDPTVVDNRYGEPKGTKLTGGLAGVRGWTTLPSEYSSTSVNTRMALLALERLAEGDQPFLLTVSYNSPHGPIEAPPEFKDYYWKNRDKLFVEPTLREVIDNSAYRDTITLDNYSEDDMREFTAAYWAVVSEVDDNVGQIMDMLQQLDLTDNTLLIFTSDHGEMLGAHGREGKTVFFEEAVRVPLLMMLPIAIPEGTKVTAPVSHLDVFATILDYCGAAEFDRSDGKSLRGKIEGNVLNDKFDEAVVVAEEDDRDPVSTSKLSGNLADEPNFMVRVGDMKLFLPKLHDAKIPDMMFDLSQDKFEEYNLLGVNADQLSLKYIYQAEYLKNSLLHWMYRMNGNKKQRFYSDPTYNFGEGQGDIKEIKQRRTWPAVEYWHSHEVLPFGSLVKTDNGYERHEWFFLGRTLKGSFKVKSIRVVGDQSSNFSVSPAVRNKKVGQDKTLRLRISFRSDERVNIRTLGARIRIDTNLGVKFVPIM